MSSMVYYVPKDNFNVSFQRRRRRRLLPFIFPLCLRASIHLKNKIEASFSASLNLHETRLLLLQA
jgi:hypothetical protein